jgi:hypothetical protein
MDESVVIGALKMGSLWANMLGTILAKDEDVGLWDDRKLAIGLIVYAAALASTTNLSEEEFLAFTTAAYRGVEFKRIKKSSKHHGEGAKK